MGDTLNIQGAKAQQSSTKSALAGPGTREPAPKIGTDSLSTHAPKTEAAAPGSLKDNDLEGLNTLTNGVRQIVLTYGIQDGQLDAAKEKQIKQNLTDEIHKLVPGGVFMVADKDSSWNIRDLTNLFNIISSMPPGDRSGLAGVTFIRSHHATAAEGASAAVRQQYGRDAANLLAELGAGGESHAHDIPEKKEGFFKRIFRGIKGIFVSGIEALEGFLHIRLLSDKTRAEYDGKPQRSVILTDTGSNLLVSSRIWAHEIGHQLQLSDGRWNPERIREFSKLSGWVETYESGKTEIFDGIDDRSGRRMILNEKLVKATRLDNFVSKYAKTDPVEDFAESYASYLLNPGLLLQKAPEKFLFINAESKKYAAEEVRDLAVKANVDLDEAGTSLVTDASLKQETISAILSTHEIKTNRAAIGAHIPLPKSPLMAAWERIVGHLAATPEAHDQAVEDPKSIIGDDAWSKLSDLDRRALEDKAFMHKMIGALGKGWAGVKTVTDATRLEEHRSGTDKALHLLLTDALFRNELAANPVGTLERAGLKDALPADVVSALTSDKNREALKNLAKRVNALTQNDLEWDRYQDNLKKLAAQISPDHFAAFAESLNDQEDRDQAAQTLENAIKTGNLIFPGDGNHPPAG